MLSLTLRQLEYVVAVGRAESLSEAARTLHISQPSLSVALTQIEAIVGQKVFLRSKGRTIERTAFGVDFLDRAAEIIDRAALLENSGRHGVTDGLWVTIGCFTDLAPVCLAPMRRFLQDRFNLAGLNHRVLGFSDLAEAMQEGSVDFAVTYDVGLDSGFEKHEQAVIAPHVFVPCDDPLADQETVGLGDLDGREIILSDEGLSYRHFLALFQRAGLDLKVGHKTSSVELMRALAAHGQGVGISYTNPPTAQSYDGMPLTSIPVSDSMAQEAVILARSKTRRLQVGIETVLDALKGAAFVPNGRT